MSNLAMSAAPLDYGPEDRDYGGGGGVSYLQTKRQYAQQQQRQQQRGGYAQGQPQTQSRHSPSSSKRVSSVLESIHQQFPDDASDDDPRFVEALTQRSSSRTPPRDIDAANSATPLHSTAAFPPNPVLSGTKANAKDKEGMRNYQGFGPDPGFGPASLGQGWPQPQPQAQAQEPAPPNEGDMDLRQLKHAFMDEAQARRYYQQLGRPVPPSSSPYPSSYSSGSSTAYAAAGGASGTDAALIDKLNYMIHLLEEQQDQRTDTVAEEVVLYSFLGIFVIFVVDSFAKVGKYVR